MLRFVSTTKKNQPSAFANGLRLAVERLEARDCPSAPSINLMAMTLYTNHMVALSGTVMDENPSSVTITFSGVASGTTTPDASGNFSYQVEASGLGTVYATGIDNENLSSTASANVTSAAPTFTTFSITSGPGRMVTLTGQISDEVPANRTVTFSGKVIGSVLTDASGNFSFTAQASGLGTIQATTTDDWGLSSNTAEVQVTGGAPTIFNFQVMQFQGCNTWTFSGHVSDESPEGLVVRFGGLPELEGRTATVTSWGDFSLTLELAEGSSGNVWAKATDCWGLDSSTALAYVI